MLVVVTGGSGSGKSAFAEETVLSFGEARRIYIATMQAFDEESHRRIRRHRHMRAGKGFETIERYTELDELLIPKDCVVLLECMSNLVANEMFREGGFHPEVAEKITEGEKSSFPGKACGDRHQRDLFRRDPLRGRIRTVQKRAGSDQPEAGRAGRRGCGSRIRDPCMA